MASIQPATLQQVLEALCTELGKAEHPCPEGTPADKWPDTARALELAESALHLARTRQPVPPDTRRLLHWLHVRTAALQEVRRLVNEPDMSNRESIRAMNQAVVHALCIGPDSKTLVQWLEVTPPAPETIMGFPVVVGTGGLPPR